jgi:hypothetical protein
VSPREKNKTERIAFLVIAGPEDPNRPVWEKAVEDALSAGDQVYVYLVDRGVLHLMEEGFHKRFRGDFVLYACSHGSVRYGVPLTKPAIFAGLQVLRDLVTGCHSFVTVPPAFSEEAEGQTIWRSPSIEDNRVDSTIGVAVHIRWDPRTSHLPVEGLRIASGLTAGISDLKICLNRQSARLLRLGPDEIVDGDMRDTYLDILQRSGAEFCHEGEIAGSTAGVTSRSVSGEEMKVILSRSDRLIVI